MTSYVFGYGSLLERASRTRTNPEAVGAWPARVTGYQRGWFHQFADNVGSTCTYLGAERANRQTINGVVYPVSDIEATKQRETGYTAVQLAADDFVMLDGSGPLKVGGDVDVYIFVSNPESISKTKEPTPTFPMVQSYVDICINGCLELESLYRGVKGSFTQERELGQRPDLSSPPVHLRAQCERHRQGSEGGKCVAVRPASRSEVRRVV